MSTVAPQFTPPEDADDLIAKAAEIECEQEQPDFSKSLEEHRQRFEISELARVQREANDVHRMRLAYADKIFALVVGWLAAVGIGVACTGFGGLGGRQFYLSDKVLIAFISSTTINVIGLFVVVAKWMYPTSGSAGTKSAESEKPQFTISLEQKKD